MVTIFTFQLGMNITWANQQKDSGGQMKRDPVYNYGQYTGNIQDDFALAYIKKEKFDCLIAADSGMEFFYRAGIQPHHIVGDFDSAKPEILSFFRGKSGIQFLEFQPEKDETDTELALRLAI